MSQSDNSEEISPNRWVQCPKCGRQVSSKRLQRHLTRVHGEYKHHPVKRHRSKSDENSMVLSTDESGRVVTYTQWIEDQKTGDDPNKSVRVIGHAAQSLSTDPDHIFEQIKQVSNFYSEPVICPLCQQQVKGSMAKHYRSKHPGATLPRNKSKKEERLSVQKQSKVVLLPVLVMRESNRPRSPHGNRTTKQRFEQLEAPCLFCGQYVKPSDWEMHTHIRHPERTQHGDLLEYKRQKIWCPLCRHAIQFNNIKNHYFEHHRGMELVGIFPPKARPAKPSHHKNDGPDLPQSKDSPVPIGKLAQEMFWQSDNEPRDGSKYLGHLQREEDGKFGSFPLHDDYDDESDAE